jgi:predicted phage tail protein
MATEVIASPEDTALSNEVMKVYQREDFMQVIQRVSSFEVPTTNVIVESVEAEKQAVALVGQVRDVKKDLEDLRKGIVTFPNKFVKTVNGMFKDLKDSCERYEKRVLDKIQPFRRKLEAEVRKAQQEAAKAAAEATQVAESLDEDVPSLPLAPEVPKTPSNVTKAGGHAVHEREEVVVNVLDAVKLIKAAIDNRKPKVKMDCITIDTSALKRNVKDEDVKPVQWLKYGVEVKIEKVAVVR